MGSAKQCVVERAPNKEIPDVIDDFDHDPPTVRIPPETMAALVYGGAGKRLFEVVSGGSAVGGHGGAVGGSGAGANRAFSMSATVGDDAGHGAGSGVTS